MGDGENFIAQPSGEIARKIRLGNDIGTQLMYLVLRPYLCHTRGMLPSSSGGLCIGHIRPGQIQVDQLGKPPISTGRRAIWIRKIWRSDF